MTDNVSISLVIEPAWSTVKHAMSRAEGFLADSGKSGDLIPATVMCVSELIENAVKYGDHGPDGEKITLQMSIDDSRISIEVCNGVANDDDMAAATEAIDRLKSGISPKTLYSNRLRELLEGGRPSASRLGLYRIAYEGGFTLDYTYEESILTLTAEKKI